MGTGLRRLASWCAASAILAGGLSGCSQTPKVPPSTDIDGLSRFYLGVFQGMAVQARDGATSAELKGIAAAAMKAWPGDATR